MFHKEIISQLCSESDETPIKAILTGYLLSRYQSSRLGSASYRSAKELSAAVANSRASTNHFFRSSSTGK